MKDTLTILEGDCIARMAELPEASAQCCVTSPPYWGLRDYGVAGQIGLEASVEEYVSKMVEVFAQVWRVLRDDGTLWLNLGDCYTASGWGGGVGSKSTIQGTQHAQDRQARKLRAGKRQWRPGSNRADGIVALVGHRNRNGAGPVEGLRFKNLIGIPWRVAFALQAGGWILRSDIIWHKPNPMPESVTDRPTKSHEYIFLFSKSERYHYDAEAIKEPSTQRAAGNVVPSKQQQAYESGDERHRTKAGLLKYAQASRLGLNRDKARANGGDHDSPFGAERNKRSVWTIATHAYAEAHFATFPPDLIKPCILAGCPAGGTVLDPFGGSGTTGMVALELGRKAVLIELNPQYAQLARERCDVTPGFQFPASNPRSISSGTPIDSSCTAP